MPPERPDIPDFYAVFGVGFDATNQELRAAWRDAVKRWHPDREPSPEATERMKQINAAWEVLGDPEARARYDAVYFTLRAAIANAEREELEAERLESERRERERMEQLEREAREREAARRRAEAAERKRREEAMRARERQEREARKREARERRERERKEREAMERDRRGRERERKDPEGRLSEERRQWWERDRLEREREAKARGQRDQEHPTDQGSSDGTGTHRGSRTPVVVGIFGGFLLGAVVVAAVVVFLLNDSEDGPSAVFVAPTSTPVSVPTPTATSVPTPVRATATPTATPLASPTPEFDFAASFQPGSVHEYLLTADRPSAAEVERLIASGAEFGYIDEIGFGTLSLAGGLGAGAEIVKVLIEAGDHPRLDPLALHWVMLSENPSPETARVLLDAGADPTYVDFYGDTAFDLAFARDDIPAETLTQLADVVRTLLDDELTPTATATSTPVVRVVYVTATARPTRSIPTVTPRPTRAPTATPMPMPAPVDQYRGSPTAFHSLLSRPSYALDAGSVAALVGAGADANALDSRGLRPLDVAASNGHDAAVFDWLISGGARVSDSPTVLHLLLGRPSYQLDAGSVKALIGAGADANALDSRGRRPLDVAASNGHDTAIFDWLLSGGAQVSDSPTVLHLLLGRPSYQLDAGSLKALVGAGADANALDSRGRRPLDVAASNGHEAAVFRSLLSGGARISDSPTALHLLLGRPSYQLDAGSLKALVGAGADANALDSRGRRPLDVAASNGHEAAVFRSLLSGGARVSDSPTALHLLLGRPSYQLDRGSVEALIRAEADVNVRDGRGRTPLDIAVSRGHEEAVISLVVPR